MLHRVRKMITSGVSWQNPFVRGVLHLLDPLDFVVRFARGLDQLPPFSVRARSNGIRGQFGGLRFANNGELIAGMLQTHALLQENSRVLEIGCGCGRTAYALTKVLQGGTYLGLDIEKVSIGFCQQCELFRAKRFTFQHLDVFNKEYNPDGTYAAASFQFPYPDESFDVIFLISVFTHMLPDDVANYMSEIGRLLKPGGRCVATTFLMDAGRVGYGISFAHDHGECCVLDPTFPELAVGYYMDFFRRHSVSCKLDVVGDPLLGPWRSAADANHSTRFRQDVLIFSKNTEKQSA